MTTSNGSAAGTDQTLTQNRVDELIEMEKEPIDNRTTWGYPGRGQSLEIGLRSVDGREKFLFDVKSGRIDLYRASYQTRWHVTTVLVRLCLNGKGHTNPDGQRLDGTHLHTYRQGYDDKYAIPVPDVFTDLDDLSRVVQDFCNYCNILHCNILRQPRLIDDDE